MSFKKAFWSIISVVVLSLWMGGCTKRAKTTDNIDVKETLFVRISGEPPTLDWSLAADTASSLVIDNLMEGLVAYDFSSSEIALRASLAESWVPSNEARSWKIKLKKGVKWSDGIEFKAQHVLDGWQRLLSAKTASEYAYFLYNVKNAKAYNAGKKNFAEVGIKAIDDYTLAIELEQPQSFFPYLLTHSSTYPIRLDVVKKYGARWTEPQNIVTLGPYRLKEWKHDKSLWLERNPTYFKAQTPIKNVMMHVIPEDSTALNLFNTGKVDLLITLPSRELMALKKREEYRSHSSLVIYYYGFNIKKPPLDNVKVRKALVHAVDRSQVTKILAGGQSPLSGWVPSGMFGHAPDTGLKFDLVLAKKLLKEAGYSDPKKVPKITIGFNTSEDHQRVAENIQAQLKDNLGIRVELQNEEWKVYLGRLKSDAPHIFRLGWAADYPDPDNFFNLLTSYSDNNHTGWKSKVFDQMVERGLASTDQSVRSGIYAKAHKFLTEQEVPVMPLYTYVDHYLISKRISGMNLNSMKKIPFKEIVIK